MFEQLFDRGFLDPFHEVGRLQNEVNRLFSRSQWGKRSGAASYPAFNLWADQEQVQLTAELPGIDAKKLDISVHGNTLTLRGELNTQNLEEEQSYLRRERPYGVFARSFELPFQVDSEKVSAEFKNGVLQMKMARSAQDKPKKIVVKGN